MTDQQRIAMYQSKKVFVDNISKAFENLTGRNSVNKVSYEVWTRYNERFNMNVYYEFIVVEFKGGAESHRNVSGTSHSGVFQEIGKLINGGYYEEKGYYESFAEEGFTKVEL